MKNYRVILIIGIIEILIGSITLVSNFASLLLSANPKPPNVLFFVFVAACVSTLLGVGILKFNKAAYELLLFFSFAVLFSKVLILMGVLELNGALETTVPGPVKSVCSIAYHAFIIYFLREEDIKKVFHIH